jgi:hypothetical protein
VGCAADLGLVAGDAGVTHQPVRGSGSGSVGKSFPAKLAFVPRLVVGAGGGGFSANASARPLRPLPTPDMRRRGMSGRRTRTGPPAGIVCTADVVIFAGELCTGMGNEHEKDGSAALVPWRIPC